MPQKKKASFADALEDNRFIELLEAAIRARLDLLGALLLDFLDLSISRRRLFAAGALFSGLHHIGLRR